MIVCRVLYKIGKLTWKLILIIWQLPQHIIGLIILLSGKAWINGVKQFHGIKYFIIPNLSGSISLGEIIILDVYMSRTVKHEYGHTLQSRILGPLYLLVIGIPSILHAIWWNNQDKKPDYHSFFTESWANKLGGLK